MPIRIGVTGSGFMGRTHADAANRLDSTEIVAVTGGSRAAELATDYNIDVEESVESMVARDDIDAVVIATPHHVHVAEALAAAKAGKHALIEKPLATSVEDADRMTSAFADRGLVLSVGYHQRFRESNKTAKRLIQSGAIGPVRCIQMTALFDIAAMRANPGFGGSWDWWKAPESRAHLLNSGPHNIDLCRWWLNSELASVVSYNGTYREDDNPNENTTMALLQFQNGAIASFWSSSVLPSPGFDGLEFSFRIMGDEGIIDHDPYGKVRLGKQGDWETVYEQPHVGHEDSNSAFGTARMQAYCDQMHGFVNSINGTPGGEGTANDGQAGVVGVLAMLESAESMQVKIIE